jgi:ribosome-binding factor A
MKKTRRTTRVGENIRDALVQIIREDLKDVDLGWSSISEVEVSPDLHYARVYITGLKEEDAKAAVDVLRDVAGQARYHLGKRIQLRFTPELDFRYDETAMRAGRIELLLSQVIPPNPENEHLGEEEEEVDESDSEDET